MIALLIALILNTTEVCVDKTGNTVELVDKGQGCSPGYKHVCWAGEAEVIDSTTVCCLLEQIGACRLVDPPLSCEPHEKWVCDAGSN